MTTEVKPTALADGWYETTRYGPIFVNNGKAWAVQIVGDRMANVVVKLSKDDIIQKSSAERTKNARQKQVARAKSRVQRTNPPNLTASAVGAMEEWVSA
jgi:hypothetical protein